jgi:DNA primase catalytic subunit
VKNKPKRSQDFDDDNMKRVKENRRKMNHFLTLKKITIEWDDIDLQEYREFLSSKNFKPSPVTTRVVRTSKGENKRDNVAISPKIINLITSNPEVNNNKANNEDNKFGSIRK